MTHRDKDPLILLVLILIIAMLTAACGPTLLEKNWGRSVKSAAYRQTLNPKAETDPEPVSGMGGQDAAAALTKHHQSFTDKPDMSFKLKVTEGK